MNKQKLVIFAFIDSQNLNLGIKSCGWDLDFTKFFVYLRDKYKVSRAFLFIGYVVGNDALYTELQKAGYIIIFKPTLEYRKRGKMLRKGNVDAELVLHAMIEYQKYDQAIIISGDGDFHCLLEYLKKKQKLRALLIPNKLQYSALLRNFAVHTDFLDSLRKKIAKKEGH